MRVRVPSGSALAALPWSPRQLAQSPLHASVARWLEMLPHDRLPGVRELDALVSRVPPLPAGFGFDPSQGPLSGADYERFIHQRGRVPTRAGSVHDLFNALVWLSFPRLKQALNRLHMAALTREGVAASRGRSRDAATLFDEHGLIVACDEPMLIDRLAAHDWHGLFVERREAVSRHMRFLVCGHGLLEQGMRPWKALTARVLPLSFAPGEIAGEWSDLMRRLDERAAQALTSSTTLAGPAAFLVLPVLGIPGWCAGNEHSAFYADATVFRPRRARTVPGGATIDAEVGQTIAAAPRAFGDARVVEESPGSTGQDAG